jgi:hypothetical protein
MTAAVNEGAARKITVGKQGIVPNAQTPHRLAPRAHPLAFANPLVG